MDKDKFIRGGYDIYVEALRADFKAKKAAMKERIAAEPDPARKQQLLDEVKLLKGQYNRAVRNAGRSLY